MEEMPKVFKECVSTLLEILDKLIVDLALRA